ncbi:MAG: hypothetical protein AAFX80_00185 [Cyanobacteria bacterium J06639_18]
MINSNSAIDPDWDRFAGYDDYLLNEGVSGSVLFDIVESPQIKQTKNRTKKYRKKSSKILSRSVKDTRELKYCREFVAKYGGEIEVSTPVGRIDILQSDSLIEAKVGLNWKHGVGQLLIYSQHFSDRQLILLLIGKNCKDYAGLAQPYCERLNIKVVTEQNYA